MTCYICYTTTVDYAQNIQISRPLATFWYKKDAEKWLEQNEFGAYVKMEIQ